jgi:hypothetical protein
MRIHIVAPALILLVLCGSPLRATTFAPADFSELVLAARAIAHGRIIDVRPQLADGRRRVETLVTLQVATYLKGSLGPTVVFRVPGGQVGRYRTIVLDAPQFSAGDEVVLLLGARGPSVPYVLGMSQGVYRISGDPVSGERRVTPAPLQGEGAEWKRVVRGDPARRPMLLTEFARTVQAVLGGHL